MDLEASLAHFGPSGSLVYDFRLSLLALGDLILESATLLLLASIPQVFEIDPKVLEIAQMNHAVCPIVDA
jgi:hypothetical protein